MATRGGLLNGIRCRQQQSSMAFLRHRAGLFGTALPARRRARLPPDITGTQLTHHGDRRQAQLCYGRHERFVGSAFCTYCCEARHHARRMPEHPVHGTAISHRRRRWRGILIIGTGRMIFADARPSPVASIYVRRRRQKLLPWPCSGFFFFRRHFVFLNGISRNQLFLMCYSPP